VRWGRRRGRGTGRAGSGRASAHEQKHASGRGFVGQRSQEDQKTAKNGPVTS
jgi:hypothetical protein